MDTDLFGTPIDAPKLARRIVAQQAEMFSGEVGTGKEGKISPREMSTRRDELGAPRREDTK